MQVRVVVVDDHAILRHGLVSLLEQQPDVEVIGEAGDGRSAVELVSQLRPDVVVLDISLPGLNGIEAARQMIQDHPSLRVIAFSAHSDQHFVHGALEAGVAGYLLKDGALENLLEAIYAVLAGNTYLSPRVANTVVSQYLDRSGGARTDGGRLSPREREVLQLMAEGANTKSIADTLNVSVKTVETHRRQIMTKLSIFSVAELTKYAIRQGLTTC